MTAAMEGDTEIAVAAAPTHLERLREHLRHPGLAIGTGLLALLLVMAVLALNLLWPRLRAVLAGRH